MNRLNGKVSSGVTNVKNYKKGDPTARKPDMEAIICDPTRVYSPQETDWDDQVSGVVDQDPTYFTIKENG